MIRPNRESPERANAYSAGTSVASAGQQHGGSGLGFRLGLRCSGNGLRDLVPAYVSNSE